MGNLGYGFCPTHPGELLKSNFHIVYLSGAKIGLFSDIHKKSVVFLVLPTKTASKTYNDLQ